MSTLEIVEIRVAKGGIHCSGCEARIESVLSRLAGVRQVSADQRTQLVRVELEGEATSSELVRRKLDELGFKIA